MSFNPEGFFPEGHFPTGFFPEANTGGRIYLAAPASRRFGLWRQSYRRWANQSCSNVGLETYATVLAPKSPDSVLDYDCVFEQPNYWRAGAVAVTDDCFRPTKPNGFEAVLYGGNGVTGAWEPRWPRLAGATVADGSVTWMMRQITDASLTRALTGTPVWSVAGLTVSGEDVYGQNGKALLAGGVDGTDYLIKVTGVFDDGTTEDQYALLPVRIPTV